MPVTVPLDASTWPLFAELAERDNGVYGGCWCTAYHGDCRPPGLDRRAFKEQLVRTGRAHAALVLDGDGAARGWCQFGSAEELPNIKHGRVYRQEPPPRPDWRITCVYVEPRQRGRGFARAALAGALDLLAGAGGGLVEALPETVDGRTAQGRFLFSGTVELFEEHGFARVRQVGKHAWIVHRRLPPSR
ncbi:GNAT family N-acetyltransferase [Kitasatospora sp. NPDC088391]|uniref:GNAT family N-acetyltransferase n=1 Tax=Kitasatospora sp. NPDC088391 TaxID=3364074 RepID=UPI00380D969E